MARHAALWGALLLLLPTAACADRSSAPSAGADSAAEAPGGDPPAAYERRAQAVARAWRAAGADRAWRTGFVPLQPLTVAPPNVPLSEAAKQALTAGWFTLAAGLPREAGGRTGTIHFPGGQTDTAPLIPLATAYDELDQGDPPSCGGPTVPPPANAPGAEAPDSPVADAPPKACVALTVTGATLGEVDLLTSRGRARVPAWLFTIRELSGPVARVAVAPSAVTDPPEVAVGELPDVSGLVGAQDLTEVRDTRLAYRLGVGACDERIRPLVVETDDVVVVAGTATRRAGACTDQLLLHPVQVTLAEPVGVRPVLDAATARVLTLPPVPEN
jgi:hypothetical protein